MIQIDDQEWPIVRLKSIDEVGLHDVEQLARSLLAVQTKLGAFVIPSDSTELREASATARVRKAVAEAVDDLADRGALLGEAVVVPKPVLRALFTGYSWLRRQTRHPQRAFPDVSSALVWAREQAGTWTALSRGGTDPI